TTHNMTLNGLVSNWVMSYAMVAPEAAAATDVGDHSFIANWTAPVDVPVDYYLLDVSTSEDFTGFLPGYEARLVEDGTSLEITGLNIKTNYYYRVRAVSEIAGHSILSNTLAVTTTGEHIPIILYVDQQV